MNGRKKVEPAKLAQVIPLRQPEIKGQPCGGVTVELRKFGHYEICVLAAGEDPNDPDHRLAVACLAHANEESIAGLEVVIATLRQRMAANGGAS